MKRSFINPHLKDMKRGLIDVLIWVLGGYKDEAPLPPPPDEFSYPNLLQPLDLNLPYVTWINHSTFYIRTPKGALLTDPIWSKRCSPVGFFGPKRQFDPPTSLIELQDLKGIVISHDHYDHLDYATVARLAAHFPDLQWIVPLKVEKWFHKYFPHVSVTPLGWGDAFELLTGWKIISVPAQHFSGRHLFKRNETLWSGYIFDYQSERGNHRIYFAGDTGYNPFDFKEIGKQFAPVDLSLLPIGAYIPSRFMRPVHIHPEEAVMIHREVGSLLSVAGHWGTFRLSGEVINRPPYDLYLALEKAGLTWKEFRVLFAGQSLNFTS